MRSAAAALGLTGDLVHALALLVGQQRPSLCSAYGMRDELVERRSHGYPADRAGRDSCPLTQPGCWAWAHVCATTPP
ncbi:MAG: hypothetical protein H0V41_13510 [Pseudonocardiales bacterium]|nr:hypothetical protein [Pseudonocardiales bacterium]